MQIVVPNRVTRAYRQRLVGSAQAGPGCEAGITCAHTGLGGEGDRFVASFTAEYFRGLTQDWESWLNHNLQHGTVLA